MFWVYYFERVMRLMMEFVVFVFTVGTKSQLIKYPEFVFINKLLLDVLIWSNVMKTHLIISSFHVHSNTNCNLQILRLSTAKVIQKLTAYSSFFNLTGLITFLVIVLILWIPCQILFKFYSSIINYSIS